MGNNHSVETLTNKLELFEGTNNIVGYVWSRNQGQRIVVVIDDFFDLPVWDYDPPSAHAYGLPVLFERISSFNLTRAIGFFPLPDPQSQNLEAQIQQIIDAVRQWIDQVGNAESRHYVLVDYYYGQGFHISRIAGLPFVAYWKRTLPLEAKLAYLSLGGEGSKLAQNTDLKVFSKLPIHGQQKLPLKLLEWLDVVENPLKRLWKNSGDWFIDDHPERLMKHEARYIMGYFADAPNKQAERYRDAVQQSLGVTFPSEWWSQPATVWAIHESLKCLCGAHFCGQVVGNNIAQRSISVGAVYLIALMAHQRVANNINALVEPEIWLDCSQPATPIFAHQDQETARSAALALYECFISLFSLHSSDLSPNRESQVKSVCFEDDGRKLKIQLFWRANHKVKNRPDSLADAIKNAFKGEGISFPTTIGDTREAILNVWRYLMISETGWGSPGTIYMDKDTLVIASTK
jgi:hypothetical protein